MVSLMPCIDPIESWEVRKATLKAAFPTPRRLAVTHACQFLISSGVKPS